VSIDEELVLRIARGDRAAEAELYEKHHGTMLLMLRKRSGDRALAEDLVQDTFTIILQRLRDRSINDPARFVAFAHRTAVNVWIGHVRKESRRKTDANSEMLTTLPGHVEDQFTTLLKTEEGRLVRTLLGELSNTRDRDILRRTYLLEEPKDAICAALQLTSAHFDRVIYRAKRRFKALVEERFEQEV